MMNATSTIPIVIATSDPVSAGLVTNLARPGGNVTGLSTMTSELYGKRLELLKETIPGLKRVGLVWHPFSPTMEKFTERVKAIAPTLSLKVIPIKVEDAAEFESAFTGASRARIQAVYLAESPLFYARRAVLARLALKARLPSLYGTSAYVNDGGFMSYGADFTDQARRTAEYVDKILKGAKPGDLPIEQSAKVQLAINLKTAKALGLTVPQSVLARADQVVQ
jgi:putative ABC transport system substrate-binding protein